jgi:hypothetical protein
MAQALLSAVDLCAAVREHLRDSRSGERKGLAPSGGSQLQAI